MAETKEPEETGDAFPYVVLIAGGVIGILVLFTKLMFHSEWASSVWTAGERAFIAIVCAVFAFWAFAKGCHQAAKRRERNKPKG